LRFLEDREQIALMTWVRLWSMHHPLLMSVYHTPNGGYRDPRTASKFKAMGVKSGVWDIFVPAPSPGLWIEMKTKTGKLSPEQRAFKTMLEPYGYTFVVARSWIEGAWALADFLGLPDEVRPEPDAVYTRKPQVTKETKRNNET
jgi:hypothetical protein